MLEVTLSNPVMVPKRFHFLNMAKNTDTSITKTDAVNFIKTAKVDGILSCNKILGFQLRKTKRGGTWYLRYTDPTGSRRRLNLGKFVDGSLDRTKAVKLALEYRLSSTQGDDPAAKVRDKKKVFSENERERENKILVTYLDGAYTEHHSTRENKGKPTLDMIRRAFKDYLNTPLDEITKEDIKEWEKKYKFGRVDKKTKQVVPRSHETVSRSYGALKTMMKHAYSNGVIKTFPLAEINISKISTEEKEAIQSQDISKRRLLTKSEIKKLNTGLALYRQKLIDGRESSRNHGKPHLPSFKNLAYPNWFFPFFRLAAYTGMRTGDLYSLKWSHLLLDFKRLVKIPNKTKHHTKPAKLDIPLDTEICAVMSAWKEQLNATDRDALVFPSPITGKQLSRDAHVKPWSNVLELGGIDYPLDFYALRHHYISKLVSNGVPLFTVARLAGHKSIKMIEEHYGHLSPHKAAEALSAIAGDFSESDLEHKIG